MIGVNITGDKMTNANTTGAKKIDANTVGAKMSDARTTGAKLTSKNNWHQNDTQKQLEPKCLTQKLALK